MPYPGPKSKYKNLKQIVTFSIFGQIVIALSCSPLMFFGGASITKTFGIVLFVATSITNIIIAIGSLEKSN